MKPEDPIDHQVILYGDDDAVLCRHVVPLIAEALQDGGAAVVIATGAHLREFRAALRSLDIDPGTPDLRERLRFFDANEILGGLLVGGRPEKGRFERLVGAPLRALRERYPVFAYGEMVGILRSAGNAEAAARLEELWIELLRTVPCRLLCGYPIDVLSSEFDADDMDAILCSHSTLLSTLEGFSDSLVAGIEAFGPAESIRGTLEPLRRPGWATLPEAEATLLWLRTNLPHHADDIIDGAMEHFSGSARDVTG